MYIDMLIQIRKTVHYHGKDQVNNFPSNISLVPQICMTVFKGSFELKQV